jgi:hypothetical protein
MVVVVLPLVGRQLVLVDVTLLRWINHRGGGLQRPSVCHSFQQAE